MNIYLMNAYAQTDVLVYKLCVNNASLAWQTHCSEGEEFQYEKTTEISMSAKIH